MDFFKTSTFHQKINPTNYKISLALCLRFQWLLTLLRIVLFVAVHGQEGKKAHFPKICQTYPRRIKLGTVIPYLNKIQELYKSRDTISQSLSSADISIFLQKSENFTVLRGTDLVCYDMVTILMISAKNRSHQQNFIVWRILYCSCGHVTKVW